MTEVEELILENQAKILTALATTHPDLNVQRVLMDAVGMTQARMAAFKVRDGGGTSLLRLFRRD